jgi:hypothetical protein
MTHVALADELLLLGYDDETGRTTTSQIALDLGMVAAILVELALRGRLAIVDNAVAVRDATPTGDPVADDILARVGADTPHSAASWVQRLRHGLRNRILASLVERGVIRETDENALDVITLHRYPTVDPAPEADTRARLAAALTGDEPPDERTAALAALVAAVRMEPTLGLQGEELETAHRRLEEIAGGAGFGPGTVLEQSTVRPSVAFVIAELMRAVDTAVGTRPQASI